MKTLKTEEHSVLIFFYLGEKLMSSEINLITLFSPCTFNSSLS